MTNSVHKNVPAEVGLYVNEVSLNLEQQLHSTREFCFVSHIFNMGKTLGLQNPKVMLVSHEFQKLYTLSGPVSIPRTALTEETQIRPFYGMLLKL